MNNQITPTTGRIVYYRGGDGQVRAAIITQVNGDFNLNLHVFPLDFTDADAYIKENVTHADPDVEPGCFPSWHWMPYQKQQAEKADDARQLTAAADREADDKRWRAGLLDLALRTPGLHHHSDVLKAAAAYQAHIEGEKPLPASHPVQQLADAVGGTIEHVERLPDGTGAAVLSMPLPADHWLTRPGYNVPPMVFRKGTDDPERQEWAEKIRAAGRYAVRCATMNGAENDFDPDALVQNLVVGMLGYFTPDGLSSDSDANPPATTA